MTEFFMPMIPPTVTAQEKKITYKKKKVIIYDPAEVTAAREKLLAHLALHIPETRYNGAVRLCTKWLFPVKGEHKNSEYKTTRPDTDNLQKMLKDCMTKLGFWKDDALVCSEIIEKFYSDTPGIYIRIDEL